MLGASAGPASRTSSSRSPWATSLARWTWTWWRRATRNPRPSWYPPPLAPRCVETVRDERISSVSAARC